MKLLIASGALPPDESATTALLRKLFPYFQDAGISITGLSCKSSFSDDNSIKDKNVAIELVNYLISTPHPQKCIKDFFYGIKKFVPRKTKQVLHIPEKRLPFSKPLKNAILKHIKRMDLAQYDAIMVVAGHFAFVEAFREYKEVYGLKVPLIFYQVDPLGDYSLIKTDDERDNLQKAEKQFYEYSDYVITTPPIYDRKNALGWNLDKVVPLEFPIDFVECPDAPLGPEIKCLFAGHLYGELRDAALTLELFSKFTNPNINLYLAGGGQEQLIKVFSDGALKGRIHHLGKLSNSDCKKAMLGTNFLINIDNKSTTQVPSKLLDYIGIGKPIINVAATKESPSLRYMERYPIGRTVFNSHEAAEIQKWIEENSTKKIPLSYREKEFAECSTKFIADKMIDIIKSSIEEK